MIIAYSATWAVSAAQGSWQTASKAKTGLLVAIGGACPPGGALTWSNWLLDLGAL